MTSTPKTPHFRRAPHASGLRAAACAEAGCAASEGPRRDDFEALFALADRRKRTRTPSANDLFLAAQSLRALGHIDAAQQELGAALSLDPGDLALDRAALSWGGTSARRAAAGRMVVRDDLDPSLRARAAAAMLEAGAEAAQSWRRTSKGVAGWIGPLELEFEADAETQTFLVDSDPDHPLAGPGVAAADVQIETASEGPLVLRLQGRGVAPAHLRALRPPASLAALDAVSLTIVVPVYDDLFATRACLEALRKSPPSLSHRVIAVDDDSPDAEISRRRRHHAGQKHREPRLRPFRQPRARFVPAGRCLAAQRRRAAAPWRHRPARGVEPRRSRCRCPDAVFKQWRVDQLSCAAHGESAAGL
jgi:hypothetical protein